MQGIEIPIGAPLGQLDKDLKGAKNKLNQFATEAAKASAIVGGSVARGSNQATFALTNLGRVAQDAPFGFIGIQNNIAPLIESFQSLKNQTGSTGSALKALGQSLVGSGGLLFAVSLITSALTILAQNPEKVAGALNYLAGVTDDTTESQKKYNEALIESGAAAKVEITNLNTLVSIARNETLSRNARLEAIKKLKAEYPAQLDFLTLEKVKSKEAADAINLLSDSILRKAKIQATEKLIGEAFTKQLEATTKSAVQQASTFSKVLGAGLGAAGIKNFIVLQNGIENQRKAFNEAQTEINNYTKILQKLNETEATTGNLFDDKKPKQYAKDVKTVSEILKQLDLDFKKTAAAVDITFGEAKKEKIKSIAKAIDELITIGIKGDSPLIKNLQNQIIGLTDIDPKIKASFVKIQGTVTNGFNALTAKIDPNGIATKFKYVNEEFIKWNKDISNIINGGVVQAFAGIGTAIGDSLAQGTSLTKNLGNVLLSTLGSVLGQLGQMAIATGVALLGIQTALLTLNPFAAIAAGVALLALSSVVKGKAAKIGGGMGASSSGDFSTPTPQSSASISTSAAASYQDFSGGRVVFEISGTNLIGVLNRAGAKLQRFG